MSVLPGNSGNAGTAMPAMFDKWRKQMETAIAPDYLAVILIGTGSSFARGPNKEEAIGNVVRRLKADWGSVFKIPKGKEVTVNVIDVAPHDEVWWDSQGFWAGKQKLAAPIEQVRRTV